MEKLSLINYRFSFLGDFLRDFSNMTNLMSNALPYDYIKKPFTDIASGFVSTAFVKSDGSLIIEFKPNRIDFVLQGYTESDLAIVKTAFEFINSEIYRHINRVAINYSFIVKDDIDHNIASKLSSRLIKSDNKTSELTYRHNQPQMINGFYINDIIQFETTISQDIEKQEDFNCIFFTIDINTAIYPNIITQESKESIFSLLKKIHELILKREKDILEVDK